jgi:hypothetical protein
VYSINRAIDTATSVCGLKLLVYAAFGMELLVYAALSY